MAVYTLLQGLRVTDAIALSLFILLATSLVVKHRSSGLRTTRLNGPTSYSVIFGAFAELTQSTEPVSLYDKWVREHGTMFSLPMAFGARSIVLSDVKAASHFLSKDTYTYQGMPFVKNIFDLLFGRGILSSEEDDHRRLRKALTPAFSNVAIKGYLNVLYDSAYKVKTSWEALLESGDATIEVQKWMNGVAFDNLGIAGFGYDFGCLNGNRPPAVDVFESFESPEHSGFISRALFFLSPVFPLLTHVPTESNRMLKSMKHSMRAIADELLERTRKELSLSPDKQAEKSMIGLLIKSERALSGLTMSSDEVMAQASNTLLIAGYETTSITMTWALIELSRNQDVQRRLREELSQLPDTDLSWEQLNLYLPYMNAVSLETMRLHSPVPHLLRTAVKDDIVPLGAPIRTAAGVTVSELVIAKGTSVYCPIGHINRSEDIWGPDAAEFKPERWLGHELPSGARGVQGHHHLLSFGDGPRICIGRNFALTNFKATLSVLIRNFSFEFPDGPDTPIVSTKALLLRPKIESEKSTSVSLKVTRLK
ncbi:cytochrome P450 [Coprinopsis marcescibilis]|uniref:Cytochrome P450 n=1 Tax=Coprinopsis marcescibilis TaxID=230819 RepID=A0A5C3KWH1_COPMA|nr:cytochrome P450 [Coprinopsis marcescibilis]